MYTNAMCLPLGERSPHGSSSFSAAFWPEGPGAQHRGVGKSESRNEKAGVARLKDSDAKLFGKTSEASQVVGKK